MSAAGSTGSVVGPLLGAVLATRNLAIPFIVVGCTAAVAGLAALAFLPPERRTEPAEPATPTAVGATADPAPVGANAGPAAAPGLWLRIQPLVRLGLWSVCFNAAYGAWITTFSAYSTTELGLTPSHVVLYFGAFGLGAILIGPTLARIADRTGRRRMIAIGTGMIFVGTVALIAVKAVMNHKELSLFRCTA